MAMAISPHLSETSREVTYWRKDFEEFRYGVIREAVSTDTADTAVRYMQILYDYYRPLLAFDEQQQSWGCYNDPLGESVLAQVWPRVSRLSGLDLLPTYSYFRMYREGGRLARHVDRPSREVSATLFLGSDEPWPICVEVDGEERQIPLGQGDLMLYRGCEVTHWRERFKGQYSVHMFLHFVEAGGQYAHLAYDEREALGAPQLRQAPIRNDAGRHTRIGAAPGIGLDGVQLAPPRRNDPCSCGSGKRYKSCHGAR